MREGEKKGGKEEGREGRREGQRDMFKFKCCALAPKCCAGKELRMGDMWRREKKKGTHP